MAGSDPIFYSSSYMNQIKNIPKRQHFQLKQYVKCTINKSAEQQLCETEASQLNSTIF